MSERSSTSQEPKVALLNDPKIRSWAFQILVVMLTIWGIYTIIQNTAANLARQGISSGFAFLGNTAGFGINFSPLVDYSETSSLFTVFWVGFQNTLILAVVGVFFATLLGFIVGVMRLSNNWVIAKMAYIYVEVLRNIPLLLQIFIWYKGVLKLLPEDTRFSINFGILGLLNIKGYLAPKPIFLEGSGFIGIALIGAIILAIVIARWAKKRQLATGQQFPTFWTSVALIILLPIIAYFIFGRPIGVDFPTSGGKFGPKGGMKLIPEFIALLVALSTYTAAFIAEIVRAGIMAVNKGQSEASYALGLSRGQTLRLNIIPQAMRVIIPPLTSQFLNLTKNSSLAVAIAYPDVTSVFAGTALNQGGQAIEIIFMIMITYLIMSLSISMVMNWYNSRVKLIER